MHGRIDRHFHSPRDENISGTLACSDGAVISQSAHSDANRPGCAFVVASGWRFGAPSPFCEAPVVPGSAYCAEHRALCVVTPHSAEGVRLLAEQRRAAAAPLPPELAGRGHLAAPEPLDPGTEDALAALDLPRMPPEEP